MSSLHHTAQAPPRLLIINPNSSPSTTKLIAHKLSMLPLGTIFDVELYTAPSGPPSINTAEDEQVSSEIVFGDLAARLKDYDAFLVACYSVHPLVAMIQDARTRPDASVIGIFEASIIAALALLPPKHKGRPSHFEKFGIVTTGRYFEKALTDGTLELLRTRGSDIGLFGGVECTGVHANELHSAASDTIESIKAATRRLVHSRKCGVIILGCAAMGDMEPIVREAIIEELGHDEKYVHVTDGVSAGVGMLEGTCRSEAGCVKLKHETLAGGC